MVMCGPRNRGAAPPATRGQSWSPGHEPSPWISFIGSLPQDWTGIESVRCQGVTGVSRCGASDRP